MEVEDELSLGKELRKLEPLAVFLLASCRQVRLCDINFVFLIAKTSTTVEVLHDQIFGLGFMT